MKKVAQKIHGYTYGLAEDGARLRGSFGGGIMTGWRGLSSLVFCAPRLLKSEVSE